MRITVFNNTEMNWSFHSSSVLPLDGSSQIPRHTGTEFEGPDGSEPFIKVWEGVVMVRFEERVEWGRLVPAKRPYVDPETGLSNL